MKKNLRLAVAIFLILAMLAAAFPASAGAVKTPVTAKIYSTGGSYPPEFREWVSEEYVWHWRNEGMEWQYVADDERLNGWAKMNNNGDSHYTADWVHLFTHVWAQWIIYSDSAYTLPIWDCRDTGMFDAEWKLTAQGTCQGLGSNKGLTAKFTITYSDWTVYYMDFQGYILEPSGS